MTFNEFFSCVIKIRCNLLNDLLSIDDHTHGEYVNSLRYILYKMTELSKGLLEKVQSKSLFNLFIEYETL